MIPKIDESDWKVAEVAIKYYGEARAAFSKVAQELAASGLLFGNDNLVGIAGEYWAKRLYHHQGWQIAEVFPSNNAGHDFRCTKATASLLVSVKVVTDWSESGRQLPLKPSAEWDELCLVLLNKELVPYLIGTATREQFHSARMARKIGTKPKVSRAWLRPKGWMTRFGNSRSSADTAWPFK
jgi:hypothetical protein